MYTQHRIISKSSIKTVVNLVQSNNLHAVIHFVSIFIIFVFVLGAPKVQSVRNLQTSTSLFLDVKRREKQGLHINPTAHGPLTNLPDYSFSDGRPTPLGVIYNNLFLFCIISNLSSIISFPVTSKATNADAKRNGSKNCTIIKGVR